MALVVDVEGKDGYTAGHCERIRDLSLATAKELGLPEDRHHSLLYGAFLHDVGKVKISTDILGKPGSLTPSEWEVMHAHPKFGADIVEPTFMREAAVIIAQHHERLDGSGYPGGLAGDAIRVEAQIVAVADTFDAMTTNRPYRNALSEAKAIQEIRGLTGIHYRKDVVGAFLRVLAS
jgi:HD-GYP domain-containing protein (c-di-GMP phosphodiesterase class II)